MVQLTLLSNMANDVNLTDMETCYKMVRADVLRELRLQSDTFTLEPEITCRLAQWGARIYEVPISYSGRTYDEGKKIKARDAVKALWEIFRCRVLDVRFTRHNGFYALKSMSRAHRYNRWLLQHCRPYIGQRILEAGAGIGNFSSMLAQLPAAGLAGSRSALRQIPEKPHGRTRPCPHRAGRSGRGSRLQPMARRTARHGPMHQCVGAHRG